MKLILFSQFGIQQDKNDDLCVPLITFLTFFNHLTIISKITMNIFIISSKINHTNQALFMYINIHSIRF